MVLAWGGIGVLGGAGVSTGNNAIQFTNHPGMFGAITLGNTISYASGFGPDTMLANGYSLGVHEGLHTFQGEILGPFYLPSNVAGGASSLAVYGKWHGPNNWNRGRAKFFSTKNVALVYEWCLYFCCFRYLAHFQTILGQERP